MMMIVMLIVGIGCVLAGLLAIAWAYAPGAWAWAGVEISTMSMMSMASATSTHDRVLLEGVIKAFSNCNGTTRMKRSALSDCNLLLNSILPGHPDATARMKRLSTEFLRQ